MRRGFTLVEVVVALVVLELAVLGVLGTLVIASETLRRAERLERATGRAEAVLDSLRGGASPGDGSATFGDVRLDWIVDDGGALRLTAIDENGGALVNVRSHVPIR